MTWSADENDTTKTIIEDRNLREANGRELRRDY